MNEFGRKTHKIINLTALKSNYNIIDSLAPKSKTIAVIKADAYGHGAIAVAKTLANIAPALAVAFINEALFLREYGVSSPVLILEGPLAKEDVYLASKHNFWLMIHSYYQLEWLLEGNYPKELPIWVKFDTGMNRLGFNEQQLIIAISKLINAKFNNIVLCSHCSCADDIENDNTLIQTKKFNAIAKLSNLPISLANSSGIINWPETYGQWNRLGIALYGGNCTNSLPLEGAKNSSLVQPSISLKPVMTLLSCVIALRSIKKGEYVGYGNHWQAKRNSTIATVSIGYGDGYPRNVKSGTPVLINDTRVPLVGRVSMDMITIDVTDLQRVKIGDTVQLWGDKLPVETIAEYADTINYELLTRISPRVKSVYC